ncbi:hypothetical protein BDQ17DRAFT_1325583 [Cyathus striatus]|nr:hypothetical protein BDQ17DRAFT_1325583 [Cyathus striatus]
MKNSLVKSNKLSQLNRLDQNFLILIILTVVSRTIILHINDPGRKGKLSKKLMKHLTLPEQNLALSAYRKYEPMQKPSIQVQHPSVYQDMALLEVESYNWTAEEKKAAALIIKGKYKRDEKLLFTTAQGDDTTGVLKEENKIQVLKSGITRLSDN